MRGEGLGVHAKSAIDSFYLFEDVIAPVRVYDYSVTDL